MAVTLNASTSSGLVQTADNSGVIALQNNGTTAVTVTGGNVGIGTGSPATKLNLSDSTQAVFRATSGTASTDVIATATGDGQVRTTGAHPLIFGTNATERMRITSSGDLCVACTSVFSFAGSTNGFYVTPTGQFVGSLTSDSNFLRRQGTDGALINIYKDTAAVGNISVTGSGTAFNTTSDYRLKENIAPMTGALETVAQLKPVTYTWKSDGSDGQGFIAHELQAIVPDAVTGVKDAVNEDGSIKPQGVDTSFLVATLTAAIQEQQAQIEELKAEVAALKGAA